jgi:drug/metabolite transporter (DMT)-like permease
VSLAAFGIVLIGAALHAVWNALIKGTGDTGITTALVVLGAGLVAVVVLPFLPPIDAASWPFLLTSTMLQTLYFALVAAAYSATSMSIAYPLMRGLAPMIVAGVGTVAIGEHPTALGWLSIALISAGVVSLAFRGRIADGRGIALALCNAVVIAGYTLVDGIGVRLSGAPPAYTLSLSLLTAVPFTAWMLLRRRAAFVEAVRSRWHLGLIGGIATVSSYGLALWAMTEAPVALVSALRETSIVFGTLIAYVVLRERIDLPRLVSTAVIVLGAIILRLA